MPLRPLTQSSFFDPEYACPACIVPGTVAWVLARKRSALFPAWLFRGWRGAGRGRNAWPATVLMTLVLLRWTEEGMSRRASVRRARTDAQWRASMGIRLDSAVPSGRTLRDFERFLRQRHPEAGVPRHLLFHEHIVRLCSDSGVVGADAVWAGDSTPMWCYGAALDTVRLLGDGLRMLAQKWARATRRTLEDVAKDWELPWLLAKSTKGGLDIDWRCAEARASAIGRLAGDVLGVVDRVNADQRESRTGLRKSVLRLARRLVRVVQNDLETDEQGRIVVARRVAQGRLVSLTDPQARHGRKSKSKTFKGFKLHIVGDVVSGLIAAVTVTPGNVHDSRPAHRLIRRAKDLFHKIDRVLADTAYGAVELRQKVRRTLGVELLAPSPKGSQPSDKTRFRKADFEVNLDEGTATCPNGVSTSELTSSAFKGVPRPRFAWPKEACSSCPLRKRCLGDAKGRRKLTLHPQERELRKLREDWAKPETRRAYRVRSQCERLVNQMVRHGGRQARAWGLAPTHLQAHAIASTCNLALLAKALAEAG